MGSITLGPFHTQLVLACVALSQCPQKTEGSRRPVRGGRCCVVCMAALARVIAWLVNSLLVKAKKSKGIYFRCQPDGNNCTLTIFCKFWADSMIAVCTLHLLNTYLCLWFC